MILESQRVQSLYDKASQTPSQISAVAFRAKGVQEGAHPSIHVLTLLKAFEEMKKSPFPAFLLTTSKSEDSAYSLADQKQRCPIRAGDSQIMHQTQHTSIDLAV